MSGETGRRVTGRKPENARRQNAKTDGAFGKEGDEQVKTGTTSRNVDKSVDKAVRRGAPVRNDARAAAGPGGPLDGRRPRSLLIT